MLLGTVPDPRQQREPHKPTRCRGGGSEEAPPTPCPQTKDGRISTWGRAADSHMRPGQGRDSGMRLDHVTLDVTPHQQTNSSHYTATSTFSGRTNIRRLTISIQQEPTAQTIAGCKICQRRGLGRTRACSCWLTAQSNRMQSRLRLGHVFTAILRRPGNRRRPPGLSLASSEVRFAK
jgi:hypothetical protein